jgi:hypothetical protein
MTKLKPTIEIPIDGPMCIGWKGDDPSEGWHCSRSVDVQGVPMCDLFRSILYLDEHGDPNRCQECLDAEAEAKRIEKLEAIGQRVEKHKETILRFPRCDFTEVNEQLWEVLDPSD